MDFEVLERLLDHLRVDLLLLEERGQRRQDDEARIDLEEVAQRGPALAAAEAVGAEHVQLRGSQRSIDAGSTFM